MGLKVHLLSSLLNEELLLSENEALTLKWLFGKMILLLNLMSIITPALIEALQPSQ